MPYAERTKWGRRVLAAARWYHTAIRTAWHTEAVSAAISALESLLVVGKEKRGKAVATRVTDRFGVLPGFDADGQRNWLKDASRKPPCLTRTSTGTDGLLPDTPRIGGGVRVARWDSAGDGL